MKEISVDLGLPKGDKSSKYIIDTIPLEGNYMDLEKEVDGYFDNYKIAKKEECWLNYEQAHMFAKHFFERGLKVQKEQMLATAIDGYVIEDIEEGNGDFLLSAEYLPKSMGLKDQQKVKVIVIKE